MTARFETRDRVAIVWVAGAIDASNAGNLRAVLYSAIESSDRGDRVIVDMRQVHRLTSAGMAALVAAKNAADARDMQFSANVELSSPTHTALVAAGVVTALHIVLVPSVAS